MPGEPPRPVPEDNGPEALRRLFDESPAAQHEINREGRIVRVNRAECELLGCPPEALLGRPVWECVPPGRAREASRRAVMAKLSGSLRPLPSERAYLRADGTELKVEIHERLLHNPQGGIVGLHTTVLDVTERVEQEERNRAILSALPDHVLLITPDGTVVEHHIPPDGAAALPQLAGTSLDSPRLGDLGERIRAALRQVSRSPQFPATFESPWSAGNGAGGYYFEGHLTRVGTGDHFLCILRDVTARRQAQQALESSEQLYSAVVSAMAEGLVVYDRNARMLSANAAAEQMFGLPPGGSAGNSLFQQAGRVLEIDGRPMAWQDYPTATVLRTGVPVLDRVLGVVRGDGSVIWVSANSEPLMREGESTPYAAVTSYTDITSRRQTELALRKSEETHRALVENLNEAVCLFDDRDRFLFANPAALRLFGLKADEVLGRAFASLLDANGRAMVEAQNARRRLGERDTYELPVTGAAGVRRILLVSATPSFSESGAYAGSLGIFYDITERKAAEEAARRTALRSQFLLDLDSRAAGLTLEEIFGLALEHALELTQSEAAFLCGLDDGDGALRAPLWRFRPEPAGRRGNITALYRQIQAPFGDRGVVLGVANKASAYDAADRAELRLVSHDLEKALARRDTDALLRKLSRAVDQSPASIVITDLDGTIEYVNPKFTEVSGYTLEETVGRNPRILKSGLMPVELYRELWSTIRGGGTWSGELRNRKKSGELYWENASISPVRDPSGTVRHFVAVKEDITARKQAEEELRAAREAADAATRAKTEFLALMSHELRTPMNGIIGMATLLGESGLSPALQDYARAIHNCADSLLNILNDILDLSKVEAGKMRLESTAFDPTTVLEEVAELTAFRAYEKNLELLLEIPERASTPVLGDPGRVRQVLLNLVSNAIKFTEHGYVRMVADCIPDPESAEGMRLEMAVEDTGIGIPSGKLPLLFEKFTQVDASDSRRFGGTGLGLAICRQLADLMGGTISVTSVEGEGTTFRCTIPVRRAAEAALNSPPQAAGLPRARVVIADPSPLGAALCARLCSEWGLAVEVVTDEGQLRESLSQGAYDVVICDRSFAVRARVAAAGRAQYARWLLLRNIHEAIDHLEPGAEWDPDATLTKPLKRATLRSTLARLLAPPDTAEASLLKVAQAVGASPARPLASFTGRRILLAEDNLVNQKLGVALLGRLGCEVTVAANGVEALEFAGERDYDLILMDCQMPRMDGYQATRELRRAARNAATPIVALTAAALPEDRARCLAAGMDDYLSKPVRAEALEATLAQWLRVGAAVGPERD